MAAVDAQEQRGIEPSLDGADRQTAEIFLLAIVDVGVMRVGADGENVLERDIARTAVLFDADRQRALTAAAAPAPREWPRARASSAGGAAAGGDAAGGGASIWSQRSSGTNDSKNAAETPKATMVVSSASVLRDSAESAATNRATSKHSGSSRMPAIAV